MRSAISVVPVIRFFIRALITGSTMVYRGTSSDLKYPHMLKQIGAAAPEGYPWSQAGKPRFAKAHSRVRLLRAWLRWFLRRPTTRMGFIAKGVSTKAVELPRREQRKS